MKINVDEHSALELIAIFIGLISLLILGWCLISWFGLYAIQRVGIIEDYKSGDVVIFALFFMAYNMLVHQKGKEK